MLAAFCSLLRRRALLAASALGLCREPRALLAYVAVDEVQVLVRFASGETAAELRVYGGATVAELARAVRAAQPRCAKAGLQLLIGDRALAPKELVGAVGPLGPDGLELLVLLLRRRFVSAGTAEATQDCKNKAVLMVGLIGDAGAGKSCMLHRLAGDSTFAEVYMPTIGIDFRVRALADDDTLLTLQVWDLAGQERFRNIITVYLRRVAACFLVFDLTDRASFDHLDGWLQLVAEHGNRGRETLVVLVGNKADLPEQWQVSNEELEQFVQSRGGLSFFKTSARYGTGVEEMLQDALHSLVDAGLL